MRVTGDILAECRIGGLDVTISFLSGTAAADGNPQRGVGRSCLLITDTSLQRFSLNFEALF